MFEFYDSDGKGEAEESASPLFFAQPLISQVKGFVEMVGVPVISLKRCMEPAVAALR